MYFGFADYNKAFDSIEHQFLWRALRDAKIEEKYLRILRYVYENSKARIKMEKTSRWFKIGRGVKQGDPLSPKLFNAALEKVFKSMNWEGKGIKIGSNFLNELRFADDVIIISQDKDELKNLTKDLIVRSKDAGLSMNMSKTKMMTNCNDVSFWIDNQEIEIVNEFKYLGQIESFEDSEMKEINIRIKNSWKIFWSMKKFFKSDLPQFHKKRLFDSCVAPVLTYGSQCWTMSKTTCERIEVEQHAMERTMLGLSLMDNINNKKLRKLSQVKDAMTTAKSLKWNWANAHFNWTSAES